MSNENRIVSQDAAVKRRLAVNIERIRRSKIVTAADDSARERYSEAAVGKLIAPDSSEPIVAYWHWLSKKPVWNDTQAKIAERIARWLGVDIKELHAGLLPETVRGRQLEIVQVAKQRFLENIHQATERVSSKRGVTKKEISQALFPNGSSSHAHKLWKSWQGTTTLPSMAAVRRLADVLKTTPDSLLVGVDKALLPKDLEKTIRAQDDRKTVRAEQDQAQPIVQIRDAKQRFLSNLKQRMNEAKVPSLFVAKIIFPRFADYLLPGAYERWEKDFSRLLDPDGQTIVLLAELLGTTSKELSQGLEIPPGTIFQNEPWLTPAYATSLLSKLRKAKTQGSLARMDDETDAKEELIDQLWHILVEHILDRLTRIACVMRDKDGPR